MRTTNRIRAAATLVWLGLALANHARADLRDRGRQYDNVSDVRIEDARLSLHTERLSGRSGPPESDRFAIDGIPAGVSSPADALANAALSSATPEENAAQVPADALAQVARDVPSTERAERAGRARSGRGRTPGRDPRAAASLPAIRRAQL